MRSGLLSTGARRRVVNVLDADPDLADGIPRAELAEAREHAVAALVSFEGFGAWEPPGDLDGRGHLGLLVIRGLLARQVTIGQRTCAELLGEGDVLRPWVRTGPADSTMAEIGWTVIAPVEIAVLDRGFALRTGRWPEIGAQLGDRILMRARYLAFHLASATWSAWRTGSC